ncbi:diacylglycerol O-acyltransferase / wax synthase [Entomortierella parvispora]|uniref:Diacylglycerol O-acyltransferase / wax synthase n=1 Tax=Entomortierella parvispora TaxID=205924 RepID=A0A9P3LYE8_9FUNG|nr:diacylglycerol O-acyltransferase / wax synthase [Entomortierella parvispora]
MTFSLEVVRPIHHLERYNVTRSNVKIYNNVAIGARFRCSELLQQPFQEERLSSLFWSRLLIGPMRQVLEAHPSLGLVVGDALSARPYFLRLPSLDLSKQIRVVTVPATAKSNEGGVTAAIEEEHNRPFDLLDLQAPVWRMVVVMNEEKSDLVSLVYTFHHVIADGRSAMAVIELLFQLLNQQAAATPSIMSDSSITDFTITPAPRRPIPEAMETLTNCFPSVRTLVWEATRAILLPSFLKKALESPYWAGDFDSTLEVPNDTQLRLLRFTKEETQQIVRSAKERGTTVQSILATASIFAAVLVFMTGLDKKREPLVFATPVSLRDLIHSRPGSTLSGPIPATDQGNYTSEILHENIQVAEDNSSSFWSMTDAYRQQVIRGTKTDRGVQELLEHFGMLALLPKDKDGSWEKFMTDKIFKDQHGRKASIKLSNLGRASWTTTSSSGASEAAFKVEDAFFSQSSGVTASALTMSVLTVNGVLNVSTTWQKAGFQGRERGDRYVEAFKQILMQAIDPDRQDYLFRDCIASFT